MQRSADCRVLMFTNIFKEKAIVGERAMQGAQSECQPEMGRIEPVEEYTRVAEPKLFIFVSGSGSTFVHNFGSGSSSSYCRILSLKTVI